jgi:hypothetical protein
MTPLELWSQNKKINDKRVIALGKVEYYSDDTDTACSYEKDEKLYIHIDGSSNLEEWFKNFRARRSGKYDSAIGYYNTARGFYIKMVHLLKQYKEVILVGVSRGGAVVMLETLDLIENALKYCLGTKFTVVTFGAPKAGGKRLMKACKRLGLKMVRFVMKGDFVPKILGWWDHCGKVIVIPNKEFGWFKKHKNYGDYLHLYSTMNF